MTKFRWPVAAAALAAGALLTSLFPAPQAAEPLRPAVWPFRDYMPAAQPQPQAARVQTVEPAQPLAPAVWSPGEYLPKNRLPASEAHRGRMHDGYRAMGLTLEWDQLMFIKPGDCVDVMATLQRAKEKNVVTLLQNVRVLDVRRSESAAGKGVLFLGFSPNEAQYAALAMDSGSVRVILRNAGDVENNPMELASFRKLFR